MTNGSGSRGLKNIRIRNAGRNTTFNVKKKKNILFITLPRSPHRGIASSRVVDPYSFFTDPDPDPEFDVGGQYGSGYGSGSGSNPIRIQGFNDQKF